MMRVRKVVNTIFRLKLLIKHTSSGVFRSAERIAEVFESVKNKLAWAEDEVCDGEVRIY